MPPALREFAYWMTRYRHNWRSTSVISLINPLLFLLGLGLGLGKLVDGSGHPPIAGFSYLAFVAPGVLAASTMQIAFLEGSNPVYQAIRTRRNYRIAAGSPLEPGQILSGHLLYVVFRLTITSAAFLAAMAVLGATHTISSLWTIPAAVLTGLAFATPAAALAVSARRPATLNLVFRFVIFPLYMLSGTFFAVSQLPPVLRDIAYLTPLWQGVDLCRTLSLGTATTANTLTHVGYLAVLTIVGTALALWRYHRELHE
ncbi:MAG TPA: ABC transporter permease [Pseudonocardiaceae bacterium]|jgi:lipooligosaccharide transport system permease protein|nr:ABC transporter permease [Pseudonocardiaceae bacterium]